MSLSSSCRGAISTIDGVVEASVARRRGAGRRAAPCRGVGGGGEKEGCSGGKQEGGGGSFSSFASRAEDSAGGFSSRFCFDFPACRRPNFLAYDATLFRALDVFLGVRN